MDSQVYIYSLKGEENIIFHSIKDPITKKACYPDILIKHDFNEKEIEDEKLYEIAESAIKKYGSSRCYFISYNDEKLLSELLEKIHSLYPMDIKESNDELINEFSEALMLSQAMTAAFKTLLTYYGDFVGKLETFKKDCYEKYGLPVATKNEGKKIYELIRQQILG